jgi:hypothetical protein
MMKNLRMSRTNHPTKRRYPAKDVVAEMAGPGRPQVDVNVGSGLAPKKSDANVFKKLPTTPPPTGNIAPVRGEGPTRNVSKS